MPTKPRSATQDPAKDFCARVRKLIDAYDEGNVSAAARRLKVSQRGLQKIYRGLVVDPRLAFIQAVIRAYRAEDPLWILMGSEGQSSAFLNTLVDARVHEALKRLASDPPRIASHRSPS